MPPCFRSAAIFGALAASLLAGCTSEISLASKPETTGSTGPAGITGGVLGGAIGTTLDEGDRPR